VRARGESAARVLLTDHPWPDLELEAQILGAAGLELVAGPSVAQDEVRIESRVRDVDPAAILTCWAPVSAAAVAAPTSLRIIARLGIGLDNIAVEQATRRGAWVSNVPDYCSSEVADHSIALMLAHFRGVVALDRAVRSKGWHNPVLSGRRISSLCVALLGFGRIGRVTAARLRAFGCRVLAHSRSLKDAGDLAEVADLRTIQAHADVIMLQMPLTPQNTNMINEEFLGRCERRPLLINVGRGGLVDNDALIRALDKHQISAAALDVIAGEPNPPAALLERTDVILTPHIAYRSEESLHELRRRACEDVVRAMGGMAPLNACNMPHAVRAG